MAILNNLIVNGVTRCLNTIYANDLTVSGSASFASLSTTGAITAGGNLTASNGYLYIGNASTNAYLYMFNKRAIRAYDNWLRINNDNDFSSGVWFGSSRVATNGTIEVGGGGNQTNASIVLTTSAATIKVPTTINSTLTTTTGKFNNVMVTDTLKAYQYDIQHVANLGGDFLVTPTYIATSGTATLSALTKNDTTISMTISDTALTNANLGGAQWLSGAKVKVAGEIDGVVLGTCDGTLTADMNTSGHTLSLSFTYTGSDIGSINTGEHAASTIKGITVMLTQIVATSGDTTTYPVGIYLTSYEKNAWPSANSQAKPSISVYGGTSTDGTTPKVRIGSLAGLPAVNGVDPSSLPSQWGIYTDNGLFAGTLASVSGKIGGWTLGASAIYSGTHSAWNTAVSGLFLGNTRISGGSGGTWYLDQGGTGKIGRWTFASNGELTTTVSSNTAGMGNGTYAFWAGAASGSAANAPFSVTYAGVLKATSATITGAINADSGYIANSVKIGGSSGTAASTVLTNITNAAKTATNYITYVDSTNGIRVYDGQSSNKNVNFSQINSNGMQVYVGGTGTANRIASFGTETVIGKIASGYKHTKVNDYSFGVYDYNTMIAGIGGTYAFQVGSGMSDTAQIQLTFSIDYSTGKLLYDTLWSKQYLSGMPLDMYIYNTADTLIAGPITIEIPYKTYEDAGTRFVEIFNFNTSYTYSNIGYLRISNVASQINDYYYSSYGKYIEFTGTYTNNIVMEVPHSGSDEEQFAYIYNIKSSSEAITAILWDGSIASGDETVAPGKTGIAVGYNTHANGDYSQAFGYNTYADDDYSHAEGYSTWAGNTAAHAEGYNAIAESPYSHAQNLNTIAGYEAQTAIGKYNDNLSNNAFEIGNGTADDARSNAFAVEWDGDVKQAGSTYYNSGKNIYGTRTDGTVQQALEPCNVNNNLVLGYGGYNNSVGSTNIYGNQINFYSKGTALFNSGIRANNHSSVIGTIKDAYPSANVSLATGTAKSVCSVSLEAGVWLINASVRFPANATGARRANVSTTSADTAIDLQWTAGSSIILQERFCRVVTISSTTTYYLNLWQNSGSTLTIAAGWGDGGTAMRAVRIQ